MPEFLGNDPPVFAGAADIKVEQRPFRCTTSTIISSSGAVFAAARSKEAGEENRHTLCQGRGFTVSVYDEPGGRR